MAALILRGHEGGERAMANEHSSGASVPGQPASDQPTSGQTAEQALAAKLPVQEKDQPDPLPRMSGGRLSAGGITLVMVAAAAVLGIVFYGLNSPAIGEHYAAAKVLQDSNAASIGTR
jgi:hypothetical protein